MSLKKGYTFLELLICLIVVGILVSLAGFVFKNAKCSHKVDTFIQELTILRNAFAGYYEAQGSFEADIENTALTDSAFNSYRPYWYPFVPSQSKVVEGAYWCAKIDQNNPKSSYVQLHINNRCASLNSKEIELLKKKLKGVCKFTAENNQHFCYILSMSDDAL